MHCCLIGHRQINVVQNCPAANLTLSAQVCSCPHGGPWKAIVTMEQSNRLASCLRSHSLISLARLSAKQRSASGPRLNAGSTPCIYQTTRYASTNGSGKRPKPFDSDFTATGAMSHAISKDDKGVLHIFRIQLPHLQKKCHKVDGIQPIHACFIIPSPRRRSRSVGPKPFSSLKSLEVTSLHKRNLAPPQGIMALYIYI